MDEPIMVACPRCGAEQEDLDGFGVLACEACGYCSHPSRDGGVCGICGDVEPVDGESADELEARLDTVHMRATRARDITGTRAVSVNRAQWAKLPVSYQVWNEDCVQGMQTRMEADSVDLVVSSIPFGALFAYSAKTEDIGNNADGVDMRASMFGLHMRFFIEQLYRVQKPGTIAAIHIQQLLTTKVQHGYMGRRDFRGAVVDLFTAGNYLWRGETVIPKNPQVIAQRTGLHSLKFETGRKDGRRLAPYVNDFVMIFQKPGDAAPVPCLYDVGRNPGGWVTTREWIRDAHGVWTDIRETDVLQDGKLQQSRSTADRVAGGREDEDEKHVCPLQLSVIERLILLYSNAQEVVFDPFGGIGSTPYVALKLGRNAAAFELKESYFAIMRKNLDRALSERKASAPKVVDLFTLAGLEV